MQAASSSRKVPKKIGLSGRGSFVDLSQREAAIMWTGEDVLRYELTGQVPERIGNRDAYQAPSGVYRCAPDEVHLGAEGTLAQGGDELPHDAEVHVGLEQGDADLAQRFVGVGGIHLIRAFIAAQRLVGANGVAKRTIKRRCVFCGVTHDLDILEALGVEIPRSGRVRYSVAGQARAHAALAEWCGFEPGTHISAILYLGWATDEPVAVPERPPVHLVHRN